jgi:CheY-like chemotaxis protein
VPLPANDFTDFLEISVEDTGIGIKQEDLMRLFQPFSQIDSSLSRHYEGTGLGLAMVMKMAELHGGTVAVCSELGKGSRFTVWLPWRKPSPELQAAVAQAFPWESAAGRVALVIEDNDRAAELVRLQLEAEGMEVIRAPSAEEALKLAGSIHPNIIILDIFLPGMDGWDFLAQVKERESPWADVPVVIASIVADTQKGFSLGAAEILQKPVARDELAAALHRVGIASVESRQGRILIIDDDLKSVEVLSAYLSDQPYTVLRAYGGKEGIEAARRELPELILLDLMMPEVSGFDVVETLRASPATAAIPIVVVTSKQLTGEDRAILNGYVTAIMEKTGFNHERFIAEVRLALAAGERGNA